VPPFGEIWRKKPKEKKTRRWKSQNAATLGKDIAEYSQSG
jgi:hypothetical protein